MALPLTVNNITFNGLHLHHNMPGYHLPPYAAQYPSHYWHSTPEYQEFVRVARIQPGESVLDLGCGPGLVGLLACEVQGGASPDVCFADVSQPFVQAAQGEAQRRYPGIPNQNFQVIADLRSPTACQQTLQAFGKPGGFNVVLVHLVANHFTQASLPHLIRHLRTLLAPGGRVVLEYGALSRSRAYSGRPWDQMVVAVRYIRRTSTFGRIQDWSMATRLQSPHIDVLASRNQRNTERDEFRQIVIPHCATLHGVHVLNQLQTNAQDHSATLRTQAQQNQNPPNQPLALQIDNERRGAVGQLVDGGQVNGADPFVEMLTFAAVYT